MIIFHFEKGLPMDAAITGTVKSVLQDVTRLGYIFEKLFWNINFSTQRGDWWSTVFSRQIFSSAIFLLIVPFRRADFSFVNAGYLDINSALFFRMCFLLSHLRMFVISVFRGSYSNSTSTPLFFFFFRISLSPHCCVNAVLLLRVLFGGSSPFTHPFPLPHLVVI